MKMKFKNIVGMAVIVATAACQQGGINDISQVDPGADNAEPTLDLVYPINGTKVQVKEDVAKINIRFNAGDDIEVGNITVNLDGKQVGTFTGSNYPDYRRVSLAFAYDQITNGDHTMSITVSDLSKKTITKTVAFSKVPAYKPMSKEVLYMPFDGDANEKVAIADAAVTGTPAYREGKKNSAYFGETGAYITYPLGDALKSQEITIAFWYKLNAVPDRSGIFTIGTSAKEDRNHGIRIFRENSETQIIKVNIGIGEDNVWNDGASIASNAGWVHLAVVISKTNSIFYLNGVPSKTAALSAPINWDDCKFITLASGEPTFAYWNHKSDLSGYDELRIFSKAMTEAEVAALKNM
ncbi:MAG: hypothetical protein CRN43_03480 [Candidatus Nephrothrix sp. EaCA]|nr:MAG: hypothetical protein CRN43_03480 [Candidatus Nephrothrix sp. EaCA]